MTKVKLGDYVSLQTQKVDNITAVNTSYVSTENLQPNKNGVLFPTASVPSSGKVNFYGVGDILVSNIRPYFKKIWMAINPGTHSSDVLNFRTKSPKLTQEYLYIVLESDSFFDYVTLTSKGTKMPRGDKDAIMDFEFSLPSLNVQQKLSNTIMTLERKILMSKQVNDNLTELITVMFNQAKDAWPTAELGNLLHPESNSIKKKEQKKARFLNTGDVTNGVFNKVDLSDTDSMPGQAKKLINKNDILYSEIRPVNRHFGLVRLDKPEEYVVSTKLMVLRRNENVQLPVEYLYFLLTSAAMIREMQFEAESRSGTFPQITFDVIKGYQVPVPPTNHPILGLIKTAINNKIDNDTESALLAETRDTLLNELLH